MLGENGTGKTTFIRMLAGLLKPDTIEGGSDAEMPEFNVSYKPQKISPKFQSTVRNLLHQKIRDAYTHPQFISDVMKPLLIEQLMDQEVVNLSGGELQRVALCLCLGKPADIYLIDEPSAYLDSEQRIHAAKVIKRFILHAKKTAFVVEHDFIMATYLADRVIVYEGKPSLDCTANSPQSLLTGMNLFLSHLDITFRRDPTIIVLGLTNLIQPRTENKRMLGLTITLTTEFTLADSFSRPTQHCFSLSFSWNINFSSFDALAYKEMIILALRASLAMN